MLLDRFAATADPAELRRHVAEARRVLGVELAGLAALSDGLDESLGAGFAQTVDLVHRQGRRLIVTGMGKSGHIARKIVATLVSTGTPTQFLHPAEASHGDLGLVQPDDAILAMSWSGETAELANVVDYARRFGIPLIAMTSNAGSTLGAAADVVLLLPQAPEACPNGLAPTTSTLMQLALGDALAMALLRARGFSADDFRRFHPGGKLGARLKRVRDLMHGDDEIPLVPRSARMTEAVVTMTSKRFGITGVVDESGRVVGVVTDGDLRRALAPDLLGRGVEEVMTRGPKTISPDMLATDALATMQGAAITALLVVDDDVPVGIIHIHDLLRAGVI